MTTNFDPEEYDDVDDAYVVKAILIAAAVTLGLIGLASVIICALTA